MRKMINEKPMLGVALSICVIVLALGFIVWFETGRQGSTHLPPLTKSFYTDDDGKTWFIDDFVKVVPFDHNGKQAVRAKIFRCGDGKPFVGYLERYSAAVQAKAQAAMAGHPDQVASALVEAPTEVKKPGEAKWVGPATGGSQNEYAGIMNIPCPEAKNESPQVVSPSDPDNGAGM